jgi:hypothetical protein
MACHKENEMNRGRITWNNGVGPIGNLCLHVGEQEALTAKLKLWNVDINDHSKIRIGQGDTEIAGIFTPILEQHGPFQGSLECMFPAAQSFIIIEAVVDENQVGEVSLSYGVV